MNMIEEIFNFNDLDDNKIDLKIKIIAKMLVHRFNNMDDDEFKDFIMKYGNERDMKNLTAGDFNAYQIAKESKIRKWTLTKKQRNAIRNVFICTELRIQKSVFLTNEEM